MNNLVELFRDKADMLREGFYTDSAREWDRWADEIERLQSKLGAVRQAVHAFSMNTLDDPYEVIEIIEKALTARDVEAQTLSTGDQGNG